MRQFLLALALCLAGQAALAQGVVDCAEFKAGWGRGLAAFKVGSGLGWAPTDRAGTEALRGLDGVAATLTCRDGIVGRAVVRAPDAQRLSAPAASLLMALDRELKREAAVSLVTALNAETEGGTKVGNGRWGPYDLTLTASGGGLELVLDLPEN